MAGKRVAFKPSQSGLQDAVRNLRAAYSLLIKAEESVMGYKAYSDVHGLVSRCVHTMERVNESFQASVRSKK